jgi:hypothetical protein
MNDLTKLGVRLSAEFTAEDRAELEAAHAAFTAVYDRILERMTDRAVASAKIVRMDDEPADAQDDLQVDAVDRALNLLYASARVSPPLRDAVATVQAGVDRLRARVPNRSDLRRVCNLADAHHRRCLYAGPTERYDHEVSLAAVSATLEAPDA